MTISHFKPEQQQELRDFVLTIQNNEFSLGFKANEQSDLEDTGSFYTGGGFWLAHHEGQLVGCIGLQKLDRTTGVLRKLFVKKEFRGTEHQIAGHLFANLKNKARTLGFERILLDTPAVAKASHRFYEKNGFLEVDRSQLPSAYKFPDRNSKIMALQLKK